MTTFTPPTNLGKLKLALQDGMRSVSYGDNSPDFSCKLKTNGSSVKSQTQTPSWMPRNSGGFCPLNKPYPSIADKPSNRTSITGGDSL